MFPMTTIGPVRIESVGETFPWCQVWIWGVRIHHWYVGAIIVAHSQLATNAGRSATQSALPPHRARRGAGGRATT